VSEDRIMRVSGRMMQNLQSEKGSLKRVRHAPARGFAVLALRKVDVNTD